MLPRLVLLRHDVPDDFGRSSHWDLLLERADDCWTWALDELPAVLNVGTGPAMVTATRLADHRKYYLDYEGPVSDGRGHVTRVLVGTYELVSHSESHVEIDATVNEKLDRLRFDCLQHQTWNLSTP